MRIEIATRGNVFEETTHHLQQQMSTRGILKIDILSILSRTHTFDLQHEGYMQSFNLLALMVWLCIAQCLKITKSLIQHCGRSELRLHFEWT